VTGLGCVELEKLTTRIPAPTKQNDDMPGVDRGTREEKRKSATRTSKKREGPELDRADARSGIDPCRIGPEPVGWTRGEHSKKRGKGDVLSKNTKETKKNSETQARA